MAPRVLYSEDSAQLFLSEADDLYRKERDEKPMSYQDSIAQVIAGSDDNDWLHRASCEDMLKYHSDRVEAKERQEGTRMSADINAAYDLLIGRNQTKK